MVRFITEATIYETFIVNTCFAADVTRRLETCNCSIKQDWDLKSALY